eukprot:10507675-Lingulodinium_polyedra.AAC.1
MGVPFQPPALLTGSVLQVDQPCEHHALGRPWHQNVVLGGAVPITRRREELFRGAARDPVPNE